MQDVRDDEPGPKPVKTSSSLVESRSSGPAATTNDVLELFQTICYHIDSFDKVAILEPILGQIAILVGVERIVLAQRTGSTLIQRTHRHDDRLSGKGEDWTVFDDVNAYTWTPNRRSGQARHFPETANGRVLALTSTFRATAVRANGTLTVLTGDTPLPQEHATKLSMIALAVGELFERLVTDSVDSQEAELARLRELTSTRLLPHTDADTDAHQAITDVLAAIAEAFEADEVIWGNRYDPNEQHSSQRYRRRQAASKVLPSIRLAVEGGIDSDPDNPIVIARLEDAAFRALDLDPAAYPASLTWITPLRSHETVLGGLGLLFFEHRADPTAEEIRFLTDTSHLLRHYEERIKAQRALKRSHHNDKLSLRIARRLLEHTSQDASAETADQIVAWTIEQLGLAFAADMVTVQTGNDMESAKNWGTSSGLARNQRLLDAQPNRFIRTASQQALHDNDVALIKLPDFSAEGRETLERLGHNGITVMAARSSDDERKVMIGVLSWDGRDWTDTDLATLSSVGTLLQQTVDAIEARRAAATFDEMEQLTTRVASRLTEHGDINEALAAILPDISSTVGAVAASWVEVTPALRRFDVTNLFNASGAKLPNFFVEFDDDDWTQIYNTTWPAGLYRHSDLPMSAVSLTAGSEMADRLFVPVYRSGRVTKALVLLVENGGWSDAVLNMLSTIAEMMHEAVERARISRLFATTFDSAPTGQLVLDERGVVQAVNEAALALQIVEVGQRWDEVDSTFSIERKEHEFPVGVDDQRRWLRVRSSTITDEATRPVTVVNIEDISSQRAAQAALHHDATHDQLTGLANRRLLDEELNKAIRGSSATVVMVDVDRFKSINDSLGHHAGDAVLLTLADRLRTTVRDGDLVCRFGGDEFAILLEGLRERHELAGFATRMLNVIRAPIDFDGYTVIPTCSLGIASIRRGEDPETVLRYADAALATAKNAGRNGYAFFDPSDYDNLRNRLSVEMGIRNGLENGEFVAWFQPEYDLDTGQVCGLEALMRWNRPGVGLVPACDFIEVAEDIGAARTMSELALQQSSALTPDWVAQSHKLKVRVNITAAQLQSDQLEVDVLRALARNDLEPKFLCLEVTERSLVADVDQTIRTLSRLRARGIEIAVDDFGTGFSSLAWLKRLPIDTIKIDRSFVDGIAIDPVDREIVRTIISLANALGLDVVAEGVENLDQVTTLRELGCRRAQGWLWSPAVEPVDVPSLLRTSAA